MVKSKATRYIGGSKKEPVEVDLYSGTLQEGEQILLCSDGLWEMTRDADGHVIHELARSSDNQEEVVRRLIAKANENGGEDNITVVVAKRSSEKPADKPVINTQATPPTIDTGNQADKMDELIKEALTYPINPPEVPKSAKFYSISHLADNVNPESANKFNNYCLFWWDGEKLYTHVIDPETGNPVAKGQVNIEIAETTDEESAKRKIEAYIKTVYRGAKFRVELIFTTEGLKPKPQEPPVPPGTH